MVPHELVDAFRRHPEKIDQVMFREQVFTALNNFEYDEALNLLQAVYGDKCSVMFRALYDSAV